VAFEDDDTPPGQGTDIHLRTFDASFTAGQGPRAPIGINGASGAGEPGTQRAPAIATGPDGTLLVAWEDDASGTVRARTLAPRTLDLGPIVELGAGGATHVALAGTLAGWVAVWQSGGDVMLRTVNEVGAVGEPAVRVNARIDASQGEPSVAALGDGRVAVVWTDGQGANGADVFIQRFDGAGRAVMGDQNAPASTTVAGDQTAPRVAAGDAGGGFFVAAWQDAASGNVRARFFGPAAEALPNAVDGTDGDFPAGATAGVTRQAPAVAVGGAGPFVVIAWETAGPPSLAGRSNVAQGIYARRFPLPAR
jgi:hypothetical protein